ncbi:phospholipase/carboxylesterase [Sporothrix brasiliensis 5110]|uniref:Phospholipase/carboxylesterase n=1 Tax=Sporothrix brasiliensis 5110 TaxID=1398154 RepID=A0A0C2F9Q1_9PEZI|nr:phospholipase/carboxylesterase [Sporothrix brasiliensis 5110]KIH87818.1 phospholipase/carboxylesterase [Sporothrix brasiliensis 5110]
MAHQEATSLAPPPPFVVEATSTHTHSIVLLHGLGSNGEKFGRELLQTGITSDGANLAQLLPNLKFIFPTSRRRRSSAFRRSVLTQWFDIARLPDPAYRKELQLKGLAESAQDLLQILQQEQETAHILPGHIILGGISQGIGGFVGMSGYLPFQADLDEAVTCDRGDGTQEDIFFMKDDDDNDGDIQDPAVKAIAFERDLLGLAPAGTLSRDCTACRTPIFLGHGSDDEKVPCSLGTAMADTVAKADYNVEFKMYEGLGHWYKIPDEIDDIANFLRRVLY